MMKKYIRITILIIVLLLNIFLIKKDVFYNVEIIINGNEEVILNVFDDYIDEGSYLLVNKSSIKEKLYDLEVTNNLNNNILGEYKITYKYKHKGKYYSKDRIIKVVDTKAPELKVGSDTVYKYNNTYSKLYYKANDNYDGDLTKNVNVTYQGTEVELKVKDSSNNETVVVLPIKEVEVEPLTLKLIGSPNYYVEVNHEYNEKGIKVFDGDSELKDYEVSIDSDLDLSHAGTYTIKYTAERYEVKSTIFRTINVYEKEEVPVKETNKEKKEKVVYLTFDDGPCAYTEDFLKVLDEYNAKATFFVTDQFNGKYLDLIKKESDAGHAIAVHTNTHQYSIYTSVEDYINDFNTMNDKIESITGSKTNMFRFPGGSSNTISRNYSNGIMKRLANLMESKGYAYFDWNVDSTDGAGSGTNTIINNVLNGVRKNNESVVLMHDIHKSTLNALPTILDTLSKEGYTFEVLTEDTMKAHHGINN